jgi:hypothetical protein
MCPQTGCVESSLERSIRIIRSHYAQSDGRFSVEPGVIRFMCCNCVSDVTICSGLQIEKDIQVLRYYYYI